MIEPSPKELMLMRQANQMSAVFFIISVFLDKELKFQPDVCNGLLMTSINLSDIVILNSKSSDCHCIINRIRKNEVISLLKNVDLTDKKQYIIK